ncbi:ATP-binding protein [Saccharopolyspora flava]|uniref:TIGR02391 family protein n=1 Tax=Saccharopolyspora flava TaxID=95161 RepID=A0A1I6QTQ6_9PSEU|nr:ATP-binding protein [Saccharopolyspora flava]SFS55770.1 TIGR02391 family protein [Saccharopolyspora flava]
MPERDEKKDLQLRFDPLTVSHLGSNMYSRMPNAVAELVANAYDADATRIAVRVNGTGHQQCIVVEDDGHGMSRDDVREKYLRIGRNRRDTELTGWSESGKRRVSGKKGLGKLALFGIGHHIEVVTTRAGSGDSLVVTMDWDDLIGTKDGDYRPGSTTESVDKSRHGTKVTISRLTRTTDIAPRSLAESLSRLFQYNDSEVSLVVIDRNGGEIPVTRDLRLESIESEIKWNIPGGLKKTAEPLLAWEVKGVIIAAKKPLATQMRGITVYTNGRLANEPEFFGAADSSYAYAYMTGYVEVDLLDTIEPDVVATDRRAVNWEHPKAAQIRQELKRMVEEIARDRKNWREDQNKKEVAETTGVDTDEWVGSISTPEKEPLNDMLNVLHSEDADMSRESRMQMLSGLQRLAPPYADFVWRHLHPRIQEVSEAAFKAGHYHMALGEGIKGYIQDLRTKADDHDDPEGKVINQFLGTGSGKRLRFAHGYTRGSLKISNSSATSLDDGNRALVQAIWQMFRNPIAHEPAATLEKLEVISPRDCLDALSLLSFLRFRLDMVEWVEP